jgi:hypothetical protein
MRSLHSYIQARVEDQQGANAQRQHPEKNVEQPDMEHSTTLLSTDKSVLGVQEAHKDDQEKKRKRKECQACGDSLTAAEIGKGGGGEHRQPAAYPAASFVGRRTDREGRSGEFVRWVEEASKAQRPSRGEKEKGRGEVGGGSRVAAS